MAPSAQSGGQGITMPSNLKSFLPLVLAIAALILGTAPSFQCETLQFPQVENDIGHVLMVGPWMYRTKFAEEWSDQTFAAQTCRNYGGGRGGLGFDYEKDAKTDTVWAFSIIAPIIGILIILKGFFQITCAGWGKGGYICMAHSYLFTAFCQGLVLIVQISSLCYDNPAMQYLEANNAELASTLSTECEICTGFVLQCVAVALWILAAGATFWVKDPVVVNEYPSQQQQVTYIQNADFTIEEKNVAVVKGDAVEQPKA